MGRGRGRRGGGNELDCQALYMKPFSFLCLFLLQRCDLSDIEEDDEDEEGPGSKSSVSIHSLCLCVNHCYTSRTLLCLSCSMDVRLYSSSTCFHCTSTSSSMLDLQLLGTPFTVVVLPFLLSIDSAVAALDNGIVDELPRLRRCFFSVRFGFGFEADWCLPALVRCRRYQDECRRRNGSSHGSLVECVASVESGWVMGRLLRRGAAAIVKRGVECYRTLVPSREGGVPTSLRRRRARLTYTTANSISYPCVTT